MMKAIAKGRRTLDFLPAVFCTLALAGPALAQAPAAPAPAQASPTPQQRVDNLKAWLAASQATLRNYQWIETTTISKDGEVKSTKQEQCLYDANGNVVKTPVPGDASSSSGSSGGLPGILPPGRLLKHLEEHEQEEMTQYLQNAVKLIHSYLPPQSSLIQQAVAAGNLAVNPVVPGSEVRLVFSNYLKSGDSLGVNIALANNQLLGIQVSSYMDTQQDPVQLDAQMSTLPDGTIFMSTATLEAKAKGLTVQVQNSGYQRINR